MFWSEEEVKVLAGMKVNMAVVSDVLDKDAGRTSIVYVVEPSEVYESSVKEMLEEGTIRITNGDKMEQ